MTLELLPEAPSNRRRRSGAEWSFAVTRALRELSAAIAGLPEVDAPVFDRLVALDRAAAVASGALGAFCAEPGAVLPAQRALMLLGARPFAPAADLSGIEAALADAPESGYSRLLESTLSAGQVSAEDPVDPADLETDLQPLGRALVDVSRALLAVDDLAHALSVPSDLAAAAVFTDGVFDLAEAAGKVKSGERAELSVAWALHRGARVGLSKLLGLRGALVEATDNLVADAVAARVAIPLAVWVLSDRLASNRQVATEDRPALDRLLVAAGLVPLEVFDAADLWRDLEG